MDKLQRLAIGLTHFIYINTAIEDMHSVKAQMDKEFNEDGYFYFKQMMDIADKHKIIYKMFLDEDNEKILSENGKIPKKQLKKRNNC